MNLDDLSTQQSALLVQNNFLSNEEIISLTETVKNLPLIKYPKGKLFGKEITFHRSIGFFSNSDGYRFSGQTIRTGDITPELQTILDKVNSSLNESFNGILINIYHSGLDYISAHSDDEKTLNSDCVAAISLGESRIFRIREKQTKKIKLDIPTEEGQLLTMKGEFQREFTHEIPIEKKKNGERISLTFRKHFK